MTTPREEPSIYVPGPYDQPPTRAFTPTPPPSAPYSPAPQPGPSGNRRSWVIAIAASSIAVLALIAGGAAVAVATGWRPPGIGTDSGVIACRRLAAVKDTSIPVPPLPAGKTRGQQARIEFAASHYSDLRLAGTAAVDLITQYGGQNGDAVALASAGQLVEKWAALSGACSAHGVTIPTLSEMAAN